MRFSAEEYYRAGLERLKQARALHDAGGSYALSMYCSGLAVECLLRGFRWDKDKSFDGRHDLEDLLKASGLLGVDEERTRSRGVPEPEVHETSLSLRAAINEVKILWSNNLRYVSEVGLRSFLHRIGRLQGIRGVPLKKNSKDLLNAASTVMERGTVLWTSRRK